MASKKASASLPVAAPIASASAGAVSGPVATIVRPAIGQRVDPFADDRDVGMRFERVGDAGREMVAVDRQRRSGGHLVLVGLAHDQRIQRAAFPGGAGRRHCCRHRRSGSCSNRPFRRGHRSGAPGSCRRSPRISDRRTRSPASASCHAASDPARPPPMMWMSCVRRPRTTNRHVTCFSNPPRSRRVEGRAKERHMSEGRDGITGDLVGGYLGGTAISCCRWRRAGTARR